MHGEKLAFATNANRPLDPSSSFSQVDSLSHHLYPERNPSEDTEVAGADAWQDHGKHGYMFFLEGSLFTR